MSLPAELEMLLKQLPKKYDIWRHFFRLTQVPRGSNQEGEHFRHEGVQKFLVDFGKGLGIETYVDKGDNVIFRKPATSGMESYPAVCLQCHMDMVCQADDEIQIDFLKDPITPYIDGPYVKAKHTSLGADNGIGVAACMSLLASSTVQHGPLEVLVTRDEETGLYGADELEAGILKAKYLINVDSEEENQICVGCAGGMNVKFTLDHTPEAWTEPASTPYTLTLSGFVGGHTGVDINLGRANPLHVSARILAAVNPDHYRLVAVHCGTADNAIPRKCELQLRIADEKAAEVLRDVKEEFSRWKHEYQLIEAAAALSCEKQEAANQSVEALSKQSTQRMVHFFNVFPYGPQRMSPVIKDLVETSCAMSVTHTAEDGKTTECVVSSRSSSGTQMKMMYQRMKSISLLTGVKVSEPFAQYPGWDPAPHSMVRDVMKQVYEEVYGKIAEEKGEAKKETLVYAIHAGLECGLIKEKYPEMDCVSMGPTINNPHSPDERLLISSVDPFMDVLIETLARLKE